MAKLYFYYAAMNAGKSTTLLQADIIIASAAWRRCSRPRRSTTAPASGMIGSRIALSAPAATYSDDIDLFAAIGEELKKRKLDCILVDEAQFLTRDHVLQLCRVADDLGIPVLCYGLRTDFQGNFSPVRRPCSRSPTR